MCLITIPNKNIYKLTLVNDNCIGGGENLRKFSILVVLLLMFSSFAAVGLSKEASDLEHINLNFSDPNVIETNLPSKKLLEINMKGANSVIYKSGEPKLPMYTKTINLPFATKITDISYDLNEIKTIDLSEKIIPAPKPVPKDGKYHEAEYEMNENIYKSNALYPINWFDIHTGAGLDENSNNVNFLTIQVYPARYNPVENKILFINNIDLTISLDKPEKNPFSANEEYDLVIITPSKFVDALQPLVEHKNEYGMLTTVKTLDEIYSQYTGFDEPEQIKYFIKDAFETMGIKYVLLVGGLNSLINAKPRDNPNKGVADWHMPVRYTNVKESGGTHDPGFLSDLYYADLYDSEGNFSTWDSNDDGIYAAWKFGAGRDVIDLYPDVYVGRLACRNTIEVQIMVNKIVNYERQAYGQSWYDRMILLGGDSFDDRGTNYLEGEVVANAIHNQFMGDFIAVKVYASHQNSDPSLTPETTNIVGEISKGAGHVFFDGHANPASWTTHWPGNFNEWISGIDIYDFYKMKNDEMLPVVCVEGCHNSQFNVSAIPSLLDSQNNNYMWTHGIPAPECWSWWMARKIGGGSLATVGNTGLGYGAVGEHGDLDGDNVTEPDILEALGGYWFYNFYKTWDEGKDILGELWAGAETKYLNTFPGNDDQSDMKTVQQLALLGDPSLKIGGYPISNKFRASIKNAGAGIASGLGDTLYLKANAKNGNAPYLFEWDLNNDGQYNDANGEEVTYSCDKLGIFEISLKATDVSNNVDIFNTLVEVQASRTTPNKPNGPSQISKGKTYSYSTNIDIDNSATLLYNFSWGDDTYSEWSESASASHKWNEEGSFKIKVKSMIITETSVVETDWSEPLSVTISKSRTSENPLILLLQRLMERFPILEKIFQPFFDI
jgi:hypothetical protein